MIGIDMVGAAPAPTAAAPAKKPAGKHKSGGKGLSATAKTIIGGLVAAVLTAGGVVAWKRYHK